MIGCKHLDDLMKTEAQVISKHIDKHKYYLHEPNDLKATIDFIKTYGEEMRIMYCGVVCPYRSDCSISNMYKDKLNELNNLDINKDILFYGSKKPII